MAKTLTFGVNLLQERVLSPEQLTRAAKEIVSTAFGEVRLQESQSKPL